MQKQSFFHQHFIKLQHVSVIKESDTWNVNPYFNDMFTFVIVLDGEGMITIGGEDFPARMDGIYKCSPNEPFNIVMKNHKEVTVYVIHFDLFSVTHESKMTTTDFPPFEKEILLHRFDQLPIFCRQMEEGLKSEDELENFHAQIILQQLIYFLYKNRRINYNQLEKKLETTKQFIEQHYNQKITIKLLAEMAQISEKYYVEMFKKVYGKTAIEYLNDVRVSNAKRLLAQSDFKLREIAHQVGINDEFYFSRMFKKKTGLAPTIYSKSRQRRIATYHIPNIGQLLALNMIPYAAPLHPKWTAYYYKHYGSDIVVHLGANKQSQQWSPNIDKLKDMQLEFIISSWPVAKREQEKIEAVAPSIFVPWEEKNWRQQLLFLADHLEETREATNWLEKYEEKLFRVKRQIKDRVKEKTFMFIRVFKQDCYLLCNRSISEVFFGDLQLTPAHSLDGQLCNQLISAEQLHRYDPDRLMVMVCQEQETLTYWETIKHTPEWQELTAVQKNDVFMVPSDPWFEYSAVAHSRMVEQVAAMFSEDSPY